MSDQNTAHEIFSENFKKFLNESDIHIGNGFAYNTSTKSFDEFMYTGKQAVATTHPEFIYNIHKKMFSSDIMRGDVGTTDGLFNYRYPCVDIPIGYTGFIYVYLGFHLRYEYRVHHCRKTCTAESILSTRPAGVLLVLKFNNGKFVKPNGWKDNVGITDRRNDNADLLFYKGSNFELFGERFNSILTEKKEAHENSFRRPAAETNDNGVNILYYLSSYNKRRCRYKYGLSAFCDTTCKCPGSAWFQVNITNATVATVENEVGEEGLITFNGSGGSDNGSVSISPFKGLYASWYNDHILGGSGGVNAWMQEYDMGFKSPGILPQMAWLSTDVGYIYDYLGNPVKY